MGKKRKIDILDFLPEEAMKVFDELGYAFLQENGYDTKGAEKSEKRRYEIAKQLKKEEIEFCYNGAIDKETQNILVWYTLKFKDGTVKKSKFLKLIPKQNSEV